MRAAGQGSGQTFDVSNNDRIVEGSISMTRSAMFKMISGPNALSKRPVNSLSWVIDSIL